MTKPGGKWKAALLKTSLPLELLVAEQLKAAGVFVLGEYQYSRVNEEGLPTEFSVDIHAKSLIPPLFKGTWATLSLLIECKYNYPGVQWIFAPNPYGNLGYRSVVNVFQQFSTRRVVPKAVDKFDADLSYCIKGIELHEDNANPNSISRGLHQLRYAVVQMLTTLLRDQLSAGHDVALNVEFVCPVLITTAPLYVLKSDLPLEAYQEAGSIADLAEEVSALVVKQDPGPDLSRYADDAFAKLLAEYPWMERRLGEHAEILATSGVPAYTIQSLSDVRVQFRAACERVLVVNHVAFPDLLTQMHTLINESGKSLQQYGTVTRNSQTGEARIHPFPPTG
jgi:hypothetical protein